MKIINGKYTRNFCCEVYHEASGSVLNSDATKSATSTAFNPVELCAISLATCIASMLGYEAEALKINIQDMKMAIGVEMADNPRRIKRIYTEFWIPANLTDHQKTLFIKVAKSCPVSHSLHPDVEHDIKFNWQEN